MVSQGHFCAFSMRISLCVCLPRRNCTTARTRPVPEIRWGRLGAWCGRSSCLKLFWDSHWLFRVRANSIAEQVGLGYSRNFMLGVPVLSSELEFRARQKQAPLHQPPVPFSNNEGGGCSVLAPDCTGEAGWL